MDNTSMFIQVLENMMVNTIVATVIQGGKQNVQTSDKSS